MNITISPAIRPEIAVTMLGRQDLNVVTLAPSSLNVIGMPGQPGPVGPPGPGLPPGGESGQVPQKASDEDYDVVWGINIKVQDTPPLSPSLNDVWIDTS